MNMKHKSEIYKVSDKHGGLRTAQLPDNENTNTSLRETDVHIIGCHTTYSWVGTVKQAMPSLCPSSPNLNYHVYMLHNSIAAVEVHVVLI